MFINLIERFGEAGKIIAEMPNDSVRIFGSSTITESGWGDIDVAATAGEVFALLLHKAMNYDGTPGIHPVIMSKEQILDLHNLMSWKEFGRTIAPNGEVFTSDDFNSGHELHFNPRSQFLFNSASAALRNAHKLEKRQVVLPKIEEAKCRACLQHSPKAIVDVLELTLEPWIMKLLEENKATIAGGFLRDTLFGKVPKDLDIFVVNGGDWEGLCNKLAQKLKEVDFRNGKERGRINLRKFAYNGITLDVIEYGFVWRKEDVVQTFDFFHNMLWYDPAIPGKLFGKDSLNDAKSIIYINLKKQLIVGDNLWFKASLTRAIYRWNRFRKEGYVPDEANRLKYSNYVKEMLPNTTQTHGVKK
jgi:hypothetical protein